METDNEKQTEMDHVSHFVKSLDDKEYEYLMTCVNERNQHAKEEGRDTAGADEGANKEQQDHEKSGDKKTGEKEVSLKDFEGD